MSPFRIDGDTGDKGVSEYRFRGKERAIFANEGYTGVGVLFWPQARAIVG